MREVERTVRHKSYRILLLAIVFCFLGALFMYLGFRDSSFGTTLRGAFTVSNSPTPRELLNPFKNYPDPRTFRTINYPEIQELTINGDCRDTYATVIIYPAVIDYRMDPSSSIYNEAEECNGNTFSRTITLNDRNLKPGDYYILRAHQGNEKTWYNPY